MKLFEYYRYKDRPHPILKGINEDKDFLEELEIVNIAKNSMTKFTY